MTNEEWLLALKAGDEVIVGGGWSGDTLQKVERASPTLITVSGTRYRRISGWPTGTGYSRTFLKMPTTESKEVAEKNELQGYLSAVKWPKVPLDKLRAVRDVLASSQSQTEAAP